MPAPCMCCWRMTWAFAHAHSFWTCSQRKGCVLICTSHPIPPSSAPKTSNQCLHPEVLTSTLTQPPAQLHTHLMFPAHLPGPVPRGQRLVALLSV